MTLFAVLGSATAGKMALYIYCVALRKNPIMVRGVRWCARRRGLGHVGLRMGLEAMAAYPEAIDISSMCLRLSLSIVLWT